MAICDGKSKPCNVLPPPQPKFPIKWNHPPAFPVNGTANLLVILWDPHRPGHPAPSKESVERLIFGADPSARGYFNEISGGQFTIKNAGVLGWYDSKKPATGYWGSKDPKDSNGDGWLNGHVEKRTEAILAADQDFDFSKFDSDGNGTLSPMELGVMIVIPQASPRGFLRTPLSRQYPTLEPLIVDGVKIEDVVEFYTGQPVDASGSAHELSHLFLDTSDMYFSFPNPLAAGAYSLMDHAYYNFSHLDPYHKVRLGWVKPKIVSQSGSYTIKSASKGGDVLAFHDPTRGFQEYFLVENRQQGLHYDQYLPNSGLVVWHIIEDRNIYRKLESPPGVSEKDWSTVKHWGARAIRRVWSGGTRRLGGWKDLIGGPISSIPLRWHDGSRSGFSITNISDSGKSDKSLCIDVPQTSFKKK